MPYDMSSRSWVLTLRSAVLALERRGPSGYRLICPSLSLFCPFHPLAAFIL